MVFMTNYLTPPTMTDPRDTASFILKKWGGKFTTDEQEVLEKIKRDGYALIEAHKMKGLFGYNYDQVGAHYCRVVFEGSKAKKNIRLDPYEMW
jgi:hypothetical protein